MLFFSPLTTLNFGVEHLHVGGEDDGYAGNENVHKVPDEGGILIDYEDCHTHSLRVAQKHHLVLVHLVDVALEQTVW